MPEVVLLIHNIRSTHNVGALFRTAEGLGVSHVYISGYSPYPALHDDTRIPHIRDKLAKQINKTALGAEALVPFTHSELPPFESLKSQGYTVVGLEQTPQSINLKDYRAPDKVALLIGEEVEGIANDILLQCDEYIEIPMRGSKESYNVSVATGMALYQLLG